MGSVVNISSVIVEVKDGECEAVLNSLAQISDISVYGLKENRIVTVIEGEDAKAVEETIKRLYALEGVVGVYPVFTSEYE